MHVDLDHLRAMLRSDLAELVGKATARWLSIDDAAGYSGLSSVSIRRLLSSGALTRHRPVRGRILVDKQQLDSLIQTSTAELRRGRGKRQ
jgi:excisionase family DNA binding protein